MKENVSLGYVSSHFLYNLHLVISMLTFHVISFTTTILRFNLSVESLKKKILHILGFFKVWLVLLQVHPNIFVHFLFLFLWSYQIYLIL